jgi:fatty acid desaturase
VIFKIPLRKEGTNMAKNDKLKEELAESRHKEIVGLRFGAFILAGLALAVAYGQWQGWLMSLPIFGLIAFGLVLGIPSIKREAGKREDKIEQLGNSEKKPATDNGAEEPTLQAIMEKLHKIQDELKEAELRDRVAAWLVLVSVGAGFAMASAVAHLWWNVLIGVGFFIIGFLGVWRKWPPRW